MKTLGIKWLFQLGRSHAPKCSVCFLEAIHNIALKFAIPFMPMEISIPHRCKELE